MVTKFLIEHTKKIVLTHGQFFKKFQKSKNEVFDHDEVLY
jgi:hypothetical protein